MVILFPAAMDILGKIKLKSQESKNMYGYWGKLLRVNLTNHTYRAEEIEKTALQKLLGGSGLGAKYLLEETEPSVDPYSPENKLIFAVGALQGSRFPGNGKWSVVTKGPLTRTFLDSAGTGSWAPYFKMTGFDLILIEGKSRSPVYLFIRNNAVEFKDASHIWGKDTIETSKIIKDELRNKRVNVLNIGPSGEIMNPVACITCDGKSFAGRGGAGAVMGSKNLKAVAAFGDQQIGLSEPENIREYCVKLHKLLHTNGKSFREHGTPSVMVPFEEMGDVPIKYWRGDVWRKGAHRIGAPQYTNQLKVKPLPCINCPLGCHRYITCEYKAGEIIKGNGPEYETIAMMGSNLLVDDLTAICKANDICNRAGVDTVSVGAFIGFLMECYESGWLSDRQASGLNLRWGDGDVLVELTRQICSMKGLGELFKDGIRGAASQIGQGAEKIIVEVKGLDYPAHDPRAVFGLGVNYATSTRGACHERGNPQASALGLFYPELGMDSPPDRFSIDEAARCAYIFQNTSALFNSLTMCKFMVSAAGLTLTEISEGMRLITGWEVDPQDLSDCGERAINLQRLINVRDGYRRKDDSLPIKMRIPAIVGGREGKTPDEHNKILDDYYDLRGWDADGLPTEERFKALGLNEYLDYIVE